jgi:hypothetical protein
VFIGRQLSTTALWTLQIGTRLDPVSIPMASREVERMPVLEQWTRAGARARFQRQGLTHTLTQSSLKGISGPEPKITTSRSMYQPTGLRDPLGTMAEREESWA